MLKKVTLVLGARNPLLLPMRDTYVASFISFVSISTKNEWNEENAGFDGGGGGDLIMHVGTFNNLESDYAHFDHVSRKTYVEHSFGAKAFWPTIIVAHTP